MTGGSSSSVAAASAVSNAGASGSSVATGGRRRQSQMSLAALQGGNNSVSIMQSTEAGVPMWLTKRGTEEVHNVEERLLDRGFSTRMYFIFIFFCLEYLDFFRLLMLGIG